MFCQCPWTLWSVGLCLPGVARLCTKRCVQAPLYPTLSDHDDYPGGRAVGRYCYFTAVHIPLVGWRCPTFPRSRHFSRSNGATAVKGAWSEAEGVHRSGAETLDGRASGVAPREVSAVGGGEGGRRWKFCTSEAS